MNLELAAQLARNEAERATKKFPRFNSAHEGYSVILEELDELWDEIKNNKKPDSRERQRNEAIQVAAMALRFLADVTPISPDEWREG